MNLIDIVEMFCDWKAASERQLDGNLLKSIEKNADRFNMDPQLKQILINTENMQITKSDNQAELPKILLK